MKKIKCMITILYVCFAVEILGAWDHLPKAKETAAFTKENQNANVVQENQQAVMQRNAEIRYVETKICELEKSNEYHARMNEKEECRQEKAWEKEQRRRCEVRQKKHQEREILQRIVEAEAGNQDLKGRIMVANVILNRVKSGRFPRTVKGVVFSPGQFSPVSNGRYYRVQVSDKTKKAVKMALNGRDYSEGALYFMCRSASEAENVSWFDRDLTRVKIHGCHEFFK